MKNNTKYELHLGDCLESLKNMPDNSVDSVVTDPPYGLSKHSQQEVIDCLSAWLKGEEYSPKGKKGFMGKSWDAWVPSPAVWRECLRVLKPGGHLLAFAGTRSMDLMSMSVRLAGFELRDSIGYAHDGGGAPLLAYCFGSGFPKSLDVSKAIDKAAGAKREVIGENPNSRPNMVRVKASVLSPRVDAPITAPATDAARQWQGWGTSLKPAWEPVILARKPLDGTVAENVLKHGTGAINIDGCRVVRDKDDESGWSKTGSKASSNRAMSGANYERNPKPDNHEGRFPANIIHDGSDEVVGLFPITQPSKASMRGIGLTGADEKVYGKGNPDFNTMRGHNDDGGSAARFFYCSKASKRDRDDGLEGFEIKRTGGMQATADGSMLTGSGNERTTLRANIHPTVKPTDLMRYLCRLVTPPNGVVLDPFTGSGSTGKAAMLEGFRFIGCEMQPEYHAIAKARIEHAMKANSDSST